MLLAIDIGNTNITLGLFPRSGEGFQKGPARIWRLSTDKKRTPDEYGISILELFRRAGIEPAGIAGVAVASVVPSLDSVFAEIARATFGAAAFFVTAQTTPMLTIRSSTPAEVGADRICDAVASNVLFGSPAIVIDFGTATTFDCIDDTGAYIGGAIAPGPAISAESLAARTAKLPRIDLVKPARAIGTTTVQGIQSGLFFGYVGLVKELLSRIAAEMGGTPVVIATGGLAGLIVPEIPDVRHIVPELTLEGIRLIYAHSLQNTHVDTVDNPVHNLPGKERR